MKQFLISFFVLSFTLTQSALVTAQEATQEATQAAAQDATQAAAQKAATGAKKRILVTKSAERLLKRPGICKSGMKCCSAKITASGSATCNNCMAADAKCGVKGAGATGPAKPVPDKAVGPSTQIQQPGTPGVLRPGEICDDDSPKCCAGEQHSDGTFICTYCAAANESCG